MTRVRLWCFLALSCCGYDVGADRLIVPTPNQSLLKHGGQERFFVGTIGKPWTSGTFGCVRSDGWQVHEGIDIKPLQRDRHGESTDPVVATADGLVVYISKNPGLSNYGKYVVIRHFIDRLEVYSLYAHLRDVSPSLKTGASVKAGQQIGILGRTTNTRTPITKDRAHLHFELNLLYNDSFPAWHRKRSTQRNDHGVWNGQNLAGMDPRQILVEQHRSAKFNLVQWLQRRPELCRVLVRKSDFPFVRRYRPLVIPNVVAAKQGIAGYEVSLDFNGVPFRLVPRAASEIPGKAKYQLIQVNASEYAKNPGRKLIVRRANQWQLTDNGLELLDLLTY